MMGTTKTLVLLAAIAVVVVPSMAVATDYTCTADAADKNCTHTLKKGDKFTLDCTGAVETVIPSTLTAGTAAGAKVCSEKAARTKVDGACVAGEVTLESLVSKKVAVTASATGITITNTDYKESAQLILTGSCKQNNNSKSAFFSVTLPKAGEGSNAKAVHVGLSAATGAALIGLAAAAF